MSLPLLVLIIESMKSQAHISINVSLPPPLFICDYIEDAEPPAALPAPVVGGASDGSASRSRSRVKLIGEWLKSRILCGGVASCLLRGVERVEPYSAPCGCFGKTVRLWRLIYPRSHN